MKSRMLLGLLIILPASAWAHPGHIESGLWYGFTHPFNGLDHILTMLAMGVWAARSGVQRWLVPGIFLLAMSAGGVLGLHGVQPSWIEPSLAASALAAGVLATLALRVPVVAQVALTALFAVWHGVAHGMELPPQVAPGSYVTGVIAATAILLASGFQLGSMLQHAQRDRWLGAGMTALAATLLWA